MFCNARVGFRDLSFKPEFAAAFAERVTGRGSEEEEERQHDKAQRQHRIARAPSDEAYEEARDVFERGPDLYSFVCGRRANFTGYVTRYGTGTVGA